MLIRGSTDLERERDREKDQKERIEILLVCTNLFCTQAKQLMLICVTGRFPFPHSTPVFDEDVTLHAKTDIICAPSGGSCLATQSSFFLYERKAIFRFRLKCLRIENMVTCGPVLHSKK